MSMNSDQLVEWDNEKMFMEFDKHDGGIPCFYGEGNFLELLVWMKMDSLQKWLRKNSIKVLKLGDITIGVKVVIL